MTDGAGSINLSLESFKGLLGKLVQYVIGFVGTIVFARILGPTGFGGFYFLLSIIFVADNPLSGVANALEKRISEADSSIDEAVGAVFGFHAVVYAILAVGLVVLGDLLAAQTNVDNAPLVFFLLFVSISLFRVFQIILSGSGYPALQIWNDTFRSVLTTPIQLVFILLSFGSAGMGYGLSAASFLTLPVAYYFVRIRPRLPSWETVESIWTFARYSIPGAVVNSAYSRLDLLLIGSLLTTAAAGQYETAYKLTKPAVLLSTAISPALLPKISNLHSRGENVAEQVTNALSFTSALAIPIFFGALAISETIVVTVYGGQYRAAATLLVGLALFQVFQTQYRVYGRTISAIDKPDLNVRVSVVTLTFNVVVGLALLVEFGALGVVVATVLAEGLRCLMSMIVLRRHVSGLPLVPRAVLAQVFAGGVMFLVVEKASDFVSASGWFDLVVLVSLGGGVYSLLLFVISPTLRVTIRSVVMDLIVGVLERTGL